MRRIILFTIFFIFFAPLALAEEEAKYNFATTTATGTILIQPGETMKVPAIYFYNIFGNRITHVSLYLTNSPEGWDVKIEPKIQIRQVNISGTFTPVEENLYVAPSQPVKEVPDTLLEGTGYITLGGVEGNIPVKIAYLNITVPSNVPIGGTYPVSVKAVGRWFGQAATLAFSQERSFDFKVQTVTHTFTEEIVTPTPEENSSGNLTNALTILALLLLVFIAILVGFYAGRKNK